MTLTEIILALTVLVETFLLGLLFYRDRTMVRRNPKPTAPASQLLSPSPRRKQFPRSKQNSLGTWVID